MIEVINNKNRKKFYKVLKERIEADPERYKFYAHGFKKMKKNPYFSKVEFLSRVGNKVIGQFGCLIDLVNDKVINIEIVCFKDNSPTFIRDLLYFFELLDSTYLNYELEIIPQAPTYKIASKMFKKFNCKYIGIKRNSVKLLDGKKYDIEIWEKKAKEEDI